MPQVKDALPNEGTTVEEEGSGVKRISGLMILLSVGYSDVFMGSLDEFLPELFFEFCRSSIDLLALQVLVKLELVEFLLLELFECLLDRYLGA